MKVSVVIPARDAAHHLAEVLAPLRELGEGWEVLVVDDGSRDGTALRAREALPGARILRHGEPRGPAAARNLAAEHARGEVLLFLDADVRVQAATLEAMAAALESVPGLAGVFGCYGEEGPEQLPVSRFRNLLHRHVHMAHAGEVPTFWAGLGALRAQAFRSAGGFRADLFPTPSIEDIELGGRLAERGWRIRLEPRFQGVHLKRWTLASMVHTDVFRRAAPWTRMILEGRAPMALNAAPRHRLTLGLLALALLLAPLRPALGLLAGAAYLACNRATYRAIAPLGPGWRTVPYLALHHLCCLGGAALGAVQFLRERWGR